MCGVRDDDAAMLWTAVVADGAMCDADCSYCVYGIVTPFECEMSSNPASAILCSIITDLNLLRAKKHYVELN